VLLVLNLTTRLRGGFMGADTVLWTLQTALALTGLLMAAWLWRAWRAAPQRRGRSLGLMAAAAGQRLVGGSLPSEARKYAQVPREGLAFHADTVPRGLLKDHTTKAGTWGRIVVRRGLLRYTIAPREDGAAPEVHELRPGVVGVVEPQVPHAVAPASQDLEFVVEFWRVGDGKRRRREA
jgi:tellurite resistance-related uncharacterized protein